MYNISKLKTDIEKTIKDLEKAKEQIDFSDRYTLIIDRVPQDEQADRPMDGDQISKGKLIIDNLIEHIGEKVTPESIEILDYFNNQVRPIFTKQLDKLKTQLNSNYQEQQKLATYYKKIEQVTHGGGGKK